ncbi:DNA polymerase alpha accessory factor Mcl1 [Coemansia sp. RSA 1722]|nr:DNA polymerase alpha accessory factor Mcl1 [Coemansia sp. RSA 486]KAJ2237753.1 DNA polymerase alpha accessory factor Mcl1 [Coemansia sp. RSA 485]KAJ2602492.1 DNA polymerase alpha accessory factor Mcl1 [Coemansia sp. RSA 1721]KAJ2606015.1 DNA polymerase alpha accessory factor Mcl1 [Coemansia sp. RSA 1722]KAJ2639595.1 DNA polymerase alpha accessory factor Mcl1 [Coemansia sp. RSA 1286]
MSHTVTDARYAHAEGYTAVTFSSDGQQLLTGGSDALIRIFQSTPHARDHEAITLEHHSDSILSLSTSANKLISGDEEGTVLSFDIDSLGQLQASGTVLRTALPARDVSISGNERMAAVAADDDVVRVVSLLDMATLHTLTGHRSAVGSVALSPDSAFLLAAGCDGTARIWDLREQDAVCVQVIPRLSYECEPGVAMQQYKARWSPCGRFIAVPASDHAVRLVERNLWESTGSLAGVHGKKITCVAWSANSRYLASVGLDGLVAVWDVNGRKHVATHKAGVALCQVAWHPQANMLAFTDSAGALRIWDDPVPVNQGYAQVFDQTEEETHIENHNRAAVDLASELFAMDETNNNNDDDDNGFGSADEIVDTGDALDDFVVDDDGSGYVEQPTMRIPTSPIIRSFQPGATPWIGDRRYLSFNMVGSVISIAQDSAHNSVEIEFFDKSAHRDMHFSDPFRYSLAALCDSGCLFATTTSELANDGSLRATTKNNTEDSSVVAFRAFAAWAAIADWTLAMPKGEHPKCLAVSSKGIAIATSLGMLRLLTCGGVQRHVESLAGNVVTCAAHDDKLLIIIENHGLQYVLMTIDGHERLATGALAVSPGSSVVWAGFSEEGQPAVCDSRGILRVLHRYWISNDACWVPVLDTKKISKTRGNRREAYWPVALSAKQLLVATCRNRTRYPGFPRPILDELDIEIPVLQPDAQQSQLESRLLTSAVFCEQQKAENNNVVRDELEQDKLVLRLVQLACKSDRAQRVVDLVMMIHLEQSFDAAIKIAIHQKQSQLAERLMRLKETKFAAEDEEEDVEEQDVEEVEEGDAVDSEQDVDMEPTANLKQRTGRSVTTYGRAQKPSSDNEEEPSTESSSALSRPPRPAKDLVTRPPTTSRPFNPFGVRSPSKSMAIQRSDSFFDAADAHSKSLSRDSSLTDFKESADKLVKRTAGDQSGGSRKVAKKTGGSSAQSKLSAFAFKKDVANKTTPTGDDDSAMDL